MDFIINSEKGIDYLVYLKDSIFFGMKIRKNLQDTFNCAIKSEMKTSDDWMYMYFNNG